VESKQWPAEDAEQTQIKPDKIPVLV
jgi:hypothetical protein